MLVWRDGKGIGRMEGFADGVEVNGALGIPTPYPSTGISWPEFMRYLELMSSLVMATLDVLSVRLLEVSCFWIVCSRTGILCIFEIELRSCSSIGHEVEAFERTSSSTCGNAQSHDSFRAGNYRY